MEAIPITQISKDLGIDKNVLMEAKLVDLENQVNKINGALKTLYSNYQNGEGWPYEDFDLPCLVPMGDDEQVVNVDEVNRIIEELAINNARKFSARKFKITDRFIERGKMKPPPSHSGDSMAVGGKKKTYKKRHIKKKRRHTKRRSTKRKHYKKTRKH